MKLSELSPVYAKLLSSRSDARVSRWEVGAAYTKRYFPDSQPFPAAPLDDLGADLRAIFGDKLTKAEPREATLDVGAILTHKELDALMPDLVELARRRETRLEISSVLVDEDEPALEVALRAYTKNPYGDKKPTGAPILEGSLSKVSSPRVDNVICPCGAEHIILHAPKSYAGQGRSDHPFLCLSCGRYELIAQCIPDGEPYEIHLKNRLPANRRARASSFVIRPRTPSAPPIFVVMGVAAVLVMVATVLLVNR